MTNTISERLGVDEPVIWLDAELFASRVLLNDKSFQWTRPVELVNTFNQMQDLLKPSVAPVNIGSFLDSWLTENRGVVQEMRGKKRVRFALKKLLSMEEPRGLIREIVSALCETVAEPLILVLPPNGDLINWANQIANNADPVDISEMDIDSVSVYLADYLRAFSGLNLAGVAVQVPNETAITNDFLDLYSPIRNVAKHYHWLFGMIAKSPAFIDCNSDEVDFVASNKAGANISVLPNTFWRDRTLEGELGAAYYTELPEDLSPETVLDCISILKNRGS